MVRRVDRWLQVMPHPAVVIEVAQNHIAGARWDSSGKQLVSAAIEALPPGSLMPSPVDTNITQPEAVRSAFRSVLSRVLDNGAPIALLIPDPVVRLFILPFESLTRRRQDALPLLRWRLKKSVPFDVEETVLSWTRQPDKNGNLEVVTAVARQRIIREYEEIAESTGAQSVVAVSSTLATLPLLEDHGATLLVRLCGKTLATVIVRDSKFCVYRATEMPAEAALLDPQAVLEEIFPAIAYYQDTWGAPLDRVRISGFGAREQLFREALAGELRVSADPLADAEGAQHFDAPGRDMIRQGHDALAGWAMNGGS
jgi:type IV pilus assembly protein PilM